jgi:hypothetical protein
MPPSLVVRIAGNAEQLRKELKDTEKAIQATSGQVQKLATSFNGDRMVTHAHNVTAAIREVGATTLTASQASRNLDLLERAMDKMRLTSQPIPDTMKRTAEQLGFVARRAEAAIPAGENMTRAYRQFDGILQSMGINIGPYVKGLEDIAGFGGKSLAAIGPLGVAAGIFGAAVAGWQIGRKIAEIADLDVKIGNLTARLLNYGDVAAQTAGAKQDTINLAIKNGADATISYSGAIAWNAEIMRQQVEVKAKAAAEAKKNEEAIKAEERATWSITETNADHFRKLQAALDANKVKKLEDARASFAASQAKGVFAETTQSATEAIASETAALKSNEDSLKSIADAAQAAADRVTAFMTASTLNDRQPDTYSGNIGPLNGFALDSVIARFGQAGENDPSKALERALSTLEGQEGRYNVTDNRSFFDMQDDVLLLAQLRELKKSGTIPGFASGVQNFSGGPAIVGERGPELVTLPRGSSVTPNHAMQPVNVTVNVNGPLVGTVSELAERVGVEVMRTMRGQGFRAPVGA